MDLTSFASKYDAQYRDRQRIGESLDPVKDMRLTLDETGLKTRESEQAVSFLADLAALSEADRTVVLRAMDPQTLMFYETALGKDVFTGQLDRGSFASFQGAPTKTFTITADVRGEAAYKAQEKEWKENPPKIPGGLLVSSKITDKTDQNYVGSIEFAGVYRDLHAAKDGAVSHFELTQSKLTPEEIVRRLMPLSGAEVAALRSAEIFTDPTDAAMFRTALGAAATVGAIPIDRPAKEADRRVFDLVMAEFGVNAEAQEINLDAANALVPGAAEAVRNAAFLTGDPQRLDGQDFQALRPRGKQVKDLANSVAERAGVLAIDNAINLLTTYQVDPEWIQLARAQSGSQSTAHASSTSEGSSTSTSRSAGETSGSFSAHSYVFGAVANAGGSIHQEERSVSNSSSNSSSAANYSAQSTSFGSYQEYLEYRAAKLPEIGRMLSEAEMQLQEAPLQSEDVGAAVQSLLKLVAGLSQSERELLMNHIRMASIKNPGGPTSKRYNGSYVFDFLPKVFGLDPLTGDTLKVRDAAVEKAQQEAEQKAQQAERAAAERAAVERAAAERRAAIVSQLDVLPRPSRYLWERVQEMALAARDNGGELASYSFSTAELLTASGFGKAQLKEHMTALVANGIVFEKAKGVYMINSEMILEP